MVIGLNIVISWLVRVPLILMQILTQLVSSTQTVFFLLSFANGRKKGLLTRLILTIQNNNTTGSITLQGCYTAIITHL